MLPVRVQFVIVVFLVDFIFSKFFGKYFVIGIGNIWLRLGVRVLSYGGLGVYPKV
jgi:hypothetical protein